MNFEIPEELLMVRQSVREFIRRELIAHEAAIDAADFAPRDLLADLRAKARASGLYAYNLPESLGGGGLPLLGQAIIAEELGRTSVPLAETLGFLPETLRLCDEQQRQLFLDDIVSGRKTVAYALTEPSAGSDLAGVTLRADRREGGFVLHGSKQFITGAAVADFVIVLAVTDKAAPLRFRFTTFVVERGAPGFVQPQPLGKMGWKGQDFSVLSFDECFVPDSHVLGGVGKGFDAIMMTINTSRIFVAGKCIGMAQQALSLAREWCLQRKAFGSLLADNPAVQFKLADMDIRVEAARLLLYRAATLGDEGHPGFRIAASRAKLLASENAGAVIDEALQLFGAAGYSSAIPIERFYRDVRAFRIGEGTSEMQRLQIARHLLAHGYPEWGTVS